MKRLHSRKKIVLFVIISVPFIGVAAALYFPRIHELRSQNAGSTTQVVKTIPADQKALQTQNQVSPDDKRGQPYTGPMKSAVIKTNTGEQQIWGDPKTVDCTVQQNAAYSAYYNALAAENVRHTQTLASLGDPNSQMLTEEERQNLFAQIAAENTRFDQTTIALANQSDAAMHANGCLGPS
ncbi:hypothetical protein KA016_00055 [Candidatus Saccharibacteria bacterium]|nr:hypothetical protein [Candidatus Saccharibacteria bacterium]